MNTEQESIYTIKISSQLKPGWKVWFNGMVAELSSPPAADGTTTLVVRVPDQAALRGLLNKIWDLNLSLISINPGIDPPERE